MKELNDDLLTQLDTWLGEQDELPLPTLEALDGYFTAALIAPELPDFQKAIPAVFGKPWGASLPEGIPEEILSLMQSLYQELLSHLSPAAELEALDQWSPLLFEVEEGTDPESKETGWGSHWAYGFHVGIEASAEARKALELAETASQETDDAEGPLQWLVPLTLLEYGGDPDESKERMTYAELKTLEGPLMDAVLELRDCFADHRRKHKLGTIQRQEAKIGRNDPCACGSGKKYKKCCGANATL